MITGTDLRRLATALALSFAVSLAVCHAQTSAQEPQTVDPQARIMTVGVHTFAPSSFMPDPFIRTFARNSLGFGVSPSVEIPPVEIGGQQYSFSSGQLVFAKLQFEFQTAIRPWLAFDVQINVLARLANETIPLISQGVVLTGGYEFGGLFEVYRTDELTLALSAGATSDATTDVDFQRFIDAVADSGEITPDNALVTTTPSVLAFGEFRLAYSINELVGLMFQAKFAYGEGLERDSPNKWYNTFAAVLDLNPSRGWDTPIGFGLGLKTRTNPAGSQESGDNITSFLGRISYVGAKDFNLALDLSYETIPLDNLPEKASFISAVIDMRLVF